MLACNLLTFIIFTNIRTNIFTNTFRLVSVFQDLHFSGDSPAPLTLAATPTLSGQHPGSLRGGTGSAPAVSTPEITSPSWMTPGWGLLLAVWMVTWCGRVSVLTADTTVTPATPPASPTTPTLSSPDLTEAWWRAGQPGSRGSTPTMMCLTQAMVTTAT